MRTSRRGTQQHRRTFWWGHVKHGDVPDELVEKIHKRVLHGMGLVVLHSGHFSKIFKKLMGTAVTSNGDSETTQRRYGRSTPLIPSQEAFLQCFELPIEEMYGEHFDIPAPDELVFVSWFSGGEVFRSGCTFRRGNGKIFYFRPGHETVPSFKNEYVRKILINGALWQSPTTPPSRTTVSSSTEKRLSNFPPGIKY